MVCRGMPYALHAHYEWGGIRRLHASPVNRFLLVSGLLSTGTRGTGKHQNCYRDASIVIARPSIGRCEENYTDFQCWLDGVDE